LLPIPFVRVRVFVLVLFSLAGLAVLALTRGLGTYLCMPGTASHCESQT
jgi:hypothetical protein